MFHDLATPSENFEVCASTDCVWLVVLRSIFGAPRRAFPVVVTRLTRLHHKKTPRIRLPALYAPLREQIFPHGKVHIWFMPRHHHLALVEHQILPPLGCFAPRLVYNNACIIKVRADARAVAFRVRDLNLETFPAPAA